MDSLLQQLDILRTNRKLVSVFSDINSPSKCSVGYIYQSDNDWVVIAHISPEGIEDGYVFRKVKDIFRIDFDGEYEKKIAALYNNKKTKHSELHLTYNNDILFSTMNEAMKTKKLLAINLAKGEDVIGYVCCVSKSFLIIQQVTEFGSEEGQTIIPIQKINKFNYDNLDLRR